MITYETLSEIRINTANGIKIIPPGKVFETSNTTAADSLLKSSKIKIHTININNLYIKRSPHSLQRPQTQDQHRYPGADIEIIKSAKSARCVDATSLSRNNPIPTNNINHWNSEMQELIAWFKTTPKQTSPFAFADHIKVISPEKFYAALEKDIAAGPRSPRSKYGALQSDLFKLRGLFEISNHEDQTDMNLK